MFLIQVGYFNTLLYTYCLVPSDCDILKRLMASPPSQKPLKTEFDYLLSFKRWDTFAELGRHVIQASVLVLFAYFFYKSVDVLAGRNTLAEIGIKFLGNLRVNRGIVALLTASGWVYGLGQRSLRRKNIERLTPAKNELERQIDKNRTSSNLTNRGTTPRKGKG